MGHDCCDAKKDELAELTQTHGTVLKLVLGINLVMFFVESAAGWLARSTALFADSLDMLGDSFVYAMSLYALSKGAQWGARVSVVKGAIMAGFGLWVLGQAVYRFVSPVLPSAEAMGSIGALALVANVTCALLLLRHRSANINMRSTWLCSRNDVIANLGILAAAGMVSWTGTRYPDLVVGALIAGLVLRSSFSVFKEALPQMRGAQ